METVIVASGTRNILSAVGIQLLSQRSRIEPNHTMRRTGITELT